MALIQGSRTIYQPPVPPPPWDTITLEEAPQEKCIDMATLQVNSYRVRRLVISGIVPARYYNFAFPQLKEICLQNVDLLLAENEEALDRNMQMLVYLNRTVERIDFENVPILPGINFWRAIFTHWRKLHELVIWTECSVTSEAAEMFWRACTLPHSISFYKKVAIPRSDALAKMTFPCVRNLSMRLVCENSLLMGPKDQLAFFMSCPDLKSLSWKLHDFDLKELQVAQALGRGTWSRLEGLCFTGSTIPDDVLQGILAQAPELKAFMDGTGGFGSLSHRTMKERHFREITFLSVSGCPAFTSAMALEVLSECYQLLFFKADHVLLEDILSSPRPWACTFLETLCLSILKKPGSDQGQDEQVFQRISKLCNMKFLDLRLPHRRKFTAPLPTEHKDRIALDPTAAMRFARLKALKGNNSLLV
ncbi:hypothetical protein BGX28_006316 [Mortierella sp. GBA30]|nr:hypothetical protein BGX28_006316 [Mortierella sp. GBA30]